MSVSQATKPSGMMGGEMAQSNALADRDEAFNTRLGSMRGWQMAIERVRPILRDFARLNLSRQVQDASLTSTLDVVLYFEQQFFEVPLLPGCVNSSRSCLSRSWAVRISPRLSAMQRNHCAACCM